MNYLTDIKSLNYNEIEKLIIDGGFPKFRTKQVVLWLKKGVSDFDEMNNIPKDLRLFLKRSCYISVATIEKKLISMYDDTVKYLFKFYDGECVESVVMKYIHGYSICVSTQVGCKMGCTFCATGKSGFSRSLTPSEILNQIEAAQKDLDIRISNVVLMGMGEPLDNFENVVRFLEIVSSENSLNIGLRHITLSTCGIVPNIYKLADLKMPVTLSVSLHAPNDTIRSKTMPVNHKYPISQLLEACVYYYNTTKRRVSFEYAMIEKTNDSDDNARELANLLSILPCHVNLIPVNSVKGTDYKKSSKERQEAFINILSHKGITATVRRTLGSDINASCGQLKRNYVDKGGK